MGEVGSCRRCGQRLDYDGERHLGMCTRCLTNPTVPVPQGMLVEGARRAARMGGADTQDRVPQVRRACQTA